MVTFFNFVWPGGEPLLLGLHYFKNIFQIQKDILGTDKTIVNQINTNATLINKDWIKFFEENNVDVIVGIDGPDEISNAHRKHKNNISASKEIINGIKLISSSSLHLKILSVITNDNYQDWHKLYEFTKTNNVKSVDFLPCYDCNDMEPISNENYFYFMKNVYDLWTKDTDNNKPGSITLISSILSALRHGESTCCTLLGNCGGRLYFDYEGNLRYCCNGMFSEDLLHMGNIKNISLKDLFLKESKYSKLIDNIEKSQDNCNDCPIFKVCHGGCTTHKKVLNGKITGLTYYCRARYWLIKYIYDNLKESELLAFDFGKLPNNPKLFQLYN